jgi:hypothetical protein
MFRLSLAIFRESILTQDKSLLVLKKTLPEYGYGQPQHVGDRTAE